MDKLRESLSARVVICDESTNKYPINSSSRGAFVAFAEYSYGSAKRWQRVLFMVLCTRIAIVSERLCEEVASGLVVALRG